MAQPYTVSKTYDIVTPESAQDGDVAESGFEFENEPMSLREVIEEVDGIGADVGGSDGFSFYGVDAQEDYRTGESTTYAVHVKANAHNMKRLWDALHMTESSRMYVRRRSNKPRSNPVRSKYDGIAGYLYSMDSSDRDASYEDGGGWWGFYDGPFAPNRKEQREHGLDADEARELRGAAAAIVHEDSQGFLDYDLYEDEDDADKEWEEIEEEVSGGDDDDDSE